MTNVLLNYKNLTIDILNNVLSSFIEQNEDAFINGIL
jgi:hypothetical protein